MARRRTANPGRREVIAAIHRLRAFGARTVNAQQIRRVLGERVPAASLATVAGANADAITNAGGAGGTFKLTNAGLQEARSHASPRSWAF